MVVDELILRIPKPIKLEAATEKRFVQLNGKSGHAVSGSRSLPWQKRRYYVVATAQDSDGQYAVKRPAFKVPITVSLHESSPSLVEVEIEYVVWCLPTSASAFAEWYHQKHFDSSVLNLTDELDSVVRESTGRILSQSSDSGRDFSQERFNEEIADELKAACGALEYKVSLHIPRSEEIRNVDTPFGVEVTFEDYSNPVVIKTKEMRLRLNNPLLYAKNDTGSGLQKWSENAVLESARKAAKKLSYLQFISGWEKNKELIKENVEKLAEGIGFKVETLLNHPETSEFAALRSLKVDLEDEEFKTKDPGITIKLSIHVDGRMIDLSSAQVQAAMNSDRSIDDAIKDSIRRRIQSILHGKSANDVFLHFLPPPADPKSKPSYEPYEKQLEEEVSCVLTDFGVAGNLGKGEEDNSKDGNGQSQNQATITVKLGQSEVVALVTDMQGEPFQWEDIEFGMLGSGLLTKYHVVIRVDGVLAPKGSLEANGYMTLALLASKNGGKTSSGGVFNARKTIANAFRVLLVDIFRRLPEEAVRYSTTGIGEELKYCINRKVREFALKQFGLSVTVSHLIRGRTAVEAMESESEEKDAERDFMDRRDKLEMWEKGERDRLQALIDKANDDTNYSPKEREEAKKDALKDLERIRGLGESDVPLQPRLDEESVLRLLQGENRRSEPANEEERQR